VISASHNLYDDNGIKFFDATGAKLSDDLEERIELEIEQGPVTRASRNLGRATRVDRSRTYYQEFALRPCRPAWTCRGSRSSLIAPTAPAYKVGPRMLADLGAGNRARRLLAQRPQHQRWLRLTLPISCR